MSCRDLRRCNRSSIRAKDRQTCSARARPLSRPTTSRRLHSSDSTSPSDRPASCNEQGWAGWKDSPESRAENAPNALEAVDRATGLSILILPPSAVGRHEPEPDVVPPNWPDPTDKV